MYRVCTYFLKEATLLIAFFLFVTIALTVEERGAGYVSNNIF